MAEGAAITDHGRLSILVVCTANQCRSPMAEALLRRRLPLAEVRSAAVLGPPGHPASVGSVRSMKALGLDLTEHRSRVLDRAEVEAADVVVCMGRLHAREVVVRVPAALATTFTLKELVRLGEERGPRPVGGSLADWLGSLRPGLRPADLLGDDPADDIADPIGQRQGRYDACALELADLVERLAVLALA